MSAPEREVEKPMTPAPAAPVAPAAPASSVGPVTTGPVTMRALLASCAAATAVSTPPRETRAAAQRAEDIEKGAVERRDAA